MQYSGIAECFLSRESHHNTWGEKTFNHFMKLYLFILVISAVKQLIVINGIQIILCLHNICVCTLYIYV